MLHSAIFLPILAVRWLFVVLEDSVEMTTLLQNYWGVRESILQRSPVTLLDDTTSEIYTKVRKNLVGGPSIVFHRYDKKCVTKIRAVEYGHNAKTCAAILGAVANTLCHLWCMSEIHADILKNDRHIRSSGYNLVTMYECKWDIFLKPSN